jgi:hypothetical protein
MLGSRGIILAFVAFNALPLTAGHKPRTAYIKLGKARVAVVRIPAGTFLKHIQGGATLFLGLLICCAIDGYAREASECRILFSCETAHHKFIRICGDEDENNVDKWTNIQYRYGSEEGTPELVFPKDPSGKPQLFFSHEEFKGDYRVSIRFSTGPYTYHVFSGSKSGAGVEVSDAKGKKLSTVECAEMPYMFAEYMRMNLPCDTENPHGAAACQKVPYGEK